MRLSDAAAVADVPDPAELAQRCPWAVATVGRDGHVTWVNDAFERCTGIPRERVLSMSEATLEATLGPLDLERTRVASDSAGVRAIHYLRVFDEAHAQLRLARLAEELREPLTSVYGFAELLLTQDYGDELRRDLTATLLEQVEAMLNVINERLDVSVGALVRQD